MGGTQCAALTFPIHRKHIIMTNIATLAPPSADAIASREALPLEQQVRLDLLDHPVLLDSKG